jgi:23S rRNA (guanosine2251-2'-O)-methyltransferase
MTSISTGKSPAAVAALRCKGAKAKISSNTFWSADAIRGEWTNTVCKGFGWAMARTPVAALARASLSSCAALIRLAGLRRAWRSRRCALWVRDVLISSCRVPAVKDPRKRPFRRDATIKRGRPAAAHFRWQRTGDEDGVVILYGWHTVTAALANPARRFRKLLATENALKRLADEGLRLPVVPELVRPDAIAAQLSPDAVHQGLFAETDPLPSPDFAELAAAGIVLVLDQITDPHNVGAILRTAAAFAVAAVVTTARHSPEATGVLAKSASGALELVPIVIVQNLARALTEMKEQGFLVVGLDSEGSEDLGAATLSAPLALVLGAEGKGLRQGTRAVCDRLARLDLPGAIKSLNVSNAAALSLYVASRAVTR